MQIVKQSATVLFLAVLSSAVAAHPHSFITLKTEIVATDNQLTGLKMRWTMDEMTSADLLYDAGDARPGDEIVGFITQGRGISIHRADCDQLAELQSHAPERIVEAVWGESYSAGYSLVVRVSANDRSGLLRDITTILANEKVNVLGVASRSDTRQQLATIDMTIEIYNLQVLGRVLGKLNQVPDVIDARRLHGRLASSLAI
jgi:(p)ppGpp synthase/HD superfamily hydrolase